MIYVIETPEGLNVVKAKGFKPKNVIGVLPDGTEGYEYQFVIKTDNGVKICDKKKSAWLKEQIKNGVSE